MSHLSITSQLVLEHLPGLIDGRTTDLAHLAVLVGDGSPVDMGTVDKCAADIRRQLEERLGEEMPDLDDDQFEGAMAGLLHPALSSLPVEVLDDPEFWAYLAAGPLWFFTKWRENPEKRKSETYHLYVDGTKNDACVPLRMFLRAQAIDDGRDYSLGQQVTQGTDFWRSHVLRVRTGAKTELARAVATEQVDERMTVGPVRAYAKRINRRWSNEVLYLLNEDECQAIARDERPSES